MDNQQQNTLEVFKIVIDFPRLEVSNKGNVRCSKTHKPRYTRVNKQGYRVVQTKVNGKRHTLKVHRLVAELFLPAPSSEISDRCAGEHWKKVVVKHIDNNKLNNSSDNLEWDRQSGNAKDAWREGLIPSLKGSSNGRATITEALVHKLCSSFEKGMMPKEAADTYGVSIQQASKIRAGIQWKHIWSLYDIKVRRRNKG